MGLRDTLSNLSPNEFLAKMQDMFQMYQESQDDYYEEGSLQRQDPRSNKIKNDSFKDFILKTVEQIIPLIRKLQGALNRKYDFNSIKDIWQRFSVKDKAEIRHYFNVYDSTNNPINEERYDYSRQLASWLELTLLLGAGLRGQGMNSSTYKEFNQKYQKN